MDRRAVIEKLRDLAREQAGYFSTAQAKRVGVSSKDLVRMAANGDLRRPSRGVYAFQGSFGGPLEDIIVSWVRLVRDRLPWDRSRPPAVASHTTAASLHGFGTFSPSAPTFTVEGRRFQPSKETVGLYTARVDPLDWQWVTAPDGIRLPTTTPARTVVDLAFAGKDRDHVLDALAEARDAGLLDDTSVREALDRRRSRRGRGSAGWLEAALARP